MANNVLPHLGKKNYIPVSNPTELLQVEFSHMLESDHSQSTIFYGEVVSIQKIIADGSSNPDLLVIELRKALTKAYSAYYDNVTVEVWVPGGDINLEAYTLNINVEVNYRDKTYQLGRALSVDASEETVKVINAINI